MANDANEKDALVTFGARIPRSHREAIEALAGKLAEEAGVRVSPSAAGASVIAAGLAAMGLLPQVPRAKGARKAARK